MQLPSHPSSTSCLKKGLQDHCLSWLVGQFPAAIAVSMPPIQALISPANDMHAAPTAAETVSAVQAQDTSNFPKATFVEALKGDGVLQSTRALKKTFADDDGAPLAARSTLNGKPALVFNPDAWKSLSENLKFALIGKFTNGCPKFSILRQRFSGFGLTGPFQIGYINFKHIVIKLSNTEDYTRLWARQVWMIDGSPMRIFKWTSEFDTKVESSVAPIWIAFPELPLHLFQKKALFELASVIGKPLKMDEPTADQTRPSVARVCVEVDVLAPRIDEIALVCGDIILQQAVTYENLPPYCCVCRHMGHKEADCYSNGRPRPPKPKETTETERKKAEIKQGKRPTQQTYVPITSKSTVPKPAGLSSHKPGIQFRDPLIDEMLHSEAAGFKDDFSHYKDGFEVDLEADVQENPTGWASEPETHSSNFKFPGQSPFAPPIVENPQTAIIPLQNSFAGLEADEDGYADCSEEEAHLSEQNLQGSEQKLQTGEQQFHVSSHSPEGQLNEDETNRALHRRANSLSPKGSGRRGGTARRSRKPKSHILDLQPTRILTRGRPTTDFISSSLP